MKSTIELLHVSKSFTIADAQVDVLKGAEYIFRQGEQYLIKGASGTGKSTLLYLMAGLEKPSTGTIMFNGRDVTQFTSAEQQLYLQKHMGLVFQYAYLISELSLLENVMLKATIAGVSTHRAQEQARHLLHAVGLETLIDRFPSGLSGGEQQRVAIARALMGEPDFLCADEPTAHLDEENKYRIRDLLYMFQKSVGCGLIICSHEQTLFSASEHVITVHDGILTERQ